MRRLLIISLVLSFGSAHAGWWNFFWPFNEPTNKKVEAVFGTPQADALVERTKAFAVQSRGQCESTNPEISLSVWEFLPDYSVEVGDGSLWPGVQAFVLDNLQVGRSAVYVERYINPGDVSEGVSTAPIFFVREGEGSLLAVVKAYLVNPDNLNGFLKELHSITLLRSLELEHSNTIDAVAVGKMRVEEQDYALLAISAASGKCITHMIRQVGIEEPDSEARRARFEQLQEAVASLATAMAEVRMVKLQDKGRIAQNFWDRDDRWWEKFIRVLGEHHELSSYVASEYDDFFDRMKTVMRTGPHEVTYVHADAHTGNYLYDADNQVLTIIDTESFAWSVARDGSPQGPPEYDYIWGGLFIDGLSRFYKLSDDERLELVSLFQITYMSFPGMPELSELSLVYHRTVFWASTVAAYMRPADGMGYTPDMEEQMAAFVAIAIEELEADYDKWSPLLLGTGQEIAAGL